MQLSFRSLILVLLGSVILTSCSTLLKNAVNKKYPPVSTIDRKLESVCFSLNNLDATKEYHAELNVSPSIIDTITHFELSRSNGLFIPKQGVIDSINIYDLDATSKPQEVSILSRQKLYISKNKFIKSVDFDVIAAISPYYSNDVLYFNPYFNRIHINKIVFRRCAFLSRLKPLTNLLNSVFKSYLENINGQIQNYHAAFKPLPEGNIKVSDILSKESDVIIEKDAMLSWTKKDFVSTIFINEQGINLMLIDKIDAPQQGSLVCIEPKLSLSAKKELFKKLYSDLGEKFSDVSKNSFDLFPNTDNSLTRMKLSNKYLERILNEAFSNLDFHFKYPIKYKEDGISSEITIHKPDFHCVCGDFCNRIIKKEGSLLKRKAADIARAVCKAACLGMGGSLNPVVGTFFTACEIGKNFWPEDYTIGSIKGNVDATGLINGAIKEITFSGSLSSVDIHNDLLVSGNLKYNFRFTSLDKFSIQRLLFAMSTNCLLLNLNGSPSIKGYVPDKLTVSINKKQDDQKSKLEIAIKPFIATVVLNTSPGLEIVKDYKNNFTCGIAYKAVGISLVLADILPSSIIPDKFRNYFDALTAGRYNHEFKLRSFLFPLDFNMRSPIGPMRISSTWGTRSINVTASY